MNQVDKTKMSKNHRERVNIAETPSKLNSPKNEQRKLFFFSSVEKCKNRRCCHIANGRKTKSSDCTEYDISNQPAPHTIPKDFLFQISYPNPTGSGWEKFYSVDKKYEEHNETIKSRKLLEELGEKLVRKKVTNNFFYGRKKYTNVFK